jgi:hypothetical protein
MKNFLTFCASWGSFTTLHIFALSQFSTGLLLALSAEDLAQAAPFAVVLGIALMVMSIFIEAIIVIRVSTALVAKKIQTAVFEKNVAQQSEVT